MERARRLPWDHSSARRPEVFRSLLREQFWQLQQIVCGTTEDEDPV